MKTGIQDKYKSTSAICLMIVLLASAFNGYTDDTTTYSSTPAVGDTDETLMTKFLYNLGGDLGFDLKTAVTSPVSSLLVSPPTLVESIAGAAIMTLFGAIPVNAGTLNASLLNFVPTSNRTYTAFNTLANSTFPSYNTPGSSSAPVSVSALIDQSTYAKDPVSQFILNLMSTPNHTYCMDPTDSVWLNNNSQTIGDCAYLYDNKILSNVAGATPALPFLDPKAQNPILDTLNGNTLIAPLLYSTTSASTSSSSSVNQGLVGTNQAEQASNFIRYATGATTAPSTPTQVNYNALLMAISSPTNDRSAKEAAIAVLDNYIISTREYAAKVSVPVGNLYSILSKRLPQGQSSSNGGTSQALSEMTMATRRIYDPSMLSTGKSQWTTQISNASPATVQKEMAILLAEINYQLYLNRQQDERLLLTNSLLLIQSLKQDMPSPPMSDSVSAVAATPSSTSTTGTTTTTTTDDGSSTSDGDDSED